MFYFLINVFMLSRLFFLFRDERLSIKKLMWIIIIQFIFLFLLELSIKTLVIFLLFFAVEYLLYLFEKKKAHVNLGRFLSLIAAAIISIIFSDISFSGALQKILTEWGIFSNWKTINIIFFGILLLLNETNFFIRYFFDVLKLVPLSKEGESGESIDTKEYNAGRVIGMLERLLIFLFVFVNQFGAIGFIIAAKGFTRFKELDKRDFAEYVLIGTLISSLFAMVIGFAVKKLTYFY